MNPPTWTVTPDSKEFLRKLRFLRRNAKANGAGTAVDYLNLLEKWVTGKWTPKKGYISDCADCQKEARRK